MKVPSQRREGLRGDDSMTPLIDVVFLLLIFFVCASVGQVAESMLPTELAEAGAVAAMQQPDDVPKQSKVWVYLTNVDGNPGLRLEGRQCADLAELASGLTQMGQLSPETPVILDVGPNVPLETLIDVWDVCNRAGFQSINFAADSVSKSGA